MASFNSTIERYRELLSEQKAGSLKLPNYNLDVGTFTAAGNRPSGLGKRSPAKSLWLPLVGGEAYGATAAVLIVAAAMHHGRLPDESRLETRGFLVS